MHIYVYICIHVHVVKMNEVWLLMIYESLIQLAVILADP
jgi:hypothetical protein